jgi:hypothetical protein
MRVNFTKRFIFFILVLTFTLLVTFTDLGFWYSLFFTLPSAWFVGLAYGVLIENIISPLNKWLNKEQ